MASLIVNSSDTEARQIRTKLPVKTTGKTESEESTDNISVSHSEDDTDKREFDRIKKHIRFYGFDKTATSNVESFFITNFLDSTIARMTVEITYSDMQDRQLHKQSAEIECAIPSGETRRTDIKTWDTQKAFYYHRSAKPRRQATPFEVSIELKSVTFITAAAAEETIINQSVEAETTGTSD